VQAWIAQGRLDFAIGVWVMHAAVLALAAWLFWRRTSLTRLFPRLRWRRAAPLAASPSGAA
jgi:hypothetical protein